MICLSCFSTRRAFDRSHSEQKLSLPRGSSTALSSLRQDPHTMRPSHLRSSISCKWGMPPSGNLSGCGTQSSHFLEAVEVQLMGSFKDLMNISSMAPVQQRRARLPTSRGGLGLPHVTSYAAIARALHTWVAAEKEWLYLTLQPHMENHPSTFFWRFADSS